MVTVIIPTYKRLDLLKRAVASVRAQTCSRWELYISDDEEPPGETWGWLQTLPADDPRIRVVRNPGPHGQVGNVNHLLGLGTAPWIKTLYDDDRLLPSCLATMLAAADAVPGASAVFCDAHHYLGGRLVGGHARSVRDFEYVPQRYVALAMYLQESVAGGTPTMCMARREAVEKGAVFHAPPGISAAVDSLWELTLSRYGDRVVVNLPLVEEHQGEHSTLTSSLNQRDLDAELAILRGIQFREIPSELRPPALATMLQTLRLIRATNRVKRGMLFEAIGLAAGCWRPASWWHYARWLARRSSGTRGRVVPRVAIDLPAVGPGGGHSRSDF